MCSTPQKDPTYDWVFNYVHCDDGELAVIKEEEIDEANVKRLECNVEHDAEQVRRKLGRSETTPMNILKLFWTREVYSLLIDKFQIGESSFDKEPTFEIWANFWP